MTILQPGQNWDGLEIVDNPRFRSRAKRPQETREELFFSKAIYAAEMCQRQDWAITVDTLRMVNPDLRASDLTDLLQTDKFANALHARGIPMTTKTGLSPRQLGALAVFMDMSTTANLTQKLRMAGVTKQEWDGWMRQPAFAARLSQLSEDQIGQQATATALQRLAQAVDNGQPWAIQLVLAMNKRYDPKQETVDPTIAIRQILDVLDEVLDGDTLKLVEERYRAKREGRDTPPAVLRIEPSPAVAEPVVADTMAPTEESD